MPTVFCPFSSCAAKITYEAIKPTTCPRCNKAFADAFRAAVKPTPAPVVADVEDGDGDDDDLPLTRSALLKRTRAGITTKVKPRAKHGGETFDDPEALAHVMNAPKPAPADDLPPDEDEDDEVVDPRQVRRRARELAASIDPSSIIIEDKDDRTISFGEIFEEAKRNGGHKAAAPKRRR